MSVKIKKSNHKFQLLNISKMILKYTNSCHYEPLSTTIIRSATF